jgi:hypothetical protein
MLKNTKWYIPVLAAVLLVTASCTNDALDNGTGADVVLEVVSLENPPVTAQQAQGGVGCTLEVEDWTASIEAAPKNSLAGTAPFNDIILHDVTVTYNWIDAALSTPTRVVGLGDTRIPAGGVSSVTFAPIAFDDLDIAQQGHTANLDLTFRATTVEGTTITSTVNRQLFVEVCDIAP